MTACSIAGFSCSARSRRLYGRGKSVAADIKQGEYRHTLLPWVRCCICMLQRRCCCCMLWAAWHQAAEEAGQQQAFPTASQPAHWFLPDCKVHGKRKAVRQTPGAQPLRIGAPYSDEDSKGRETLNPKASHRGAGANPAASRLAFTPAAECMARARLWRRRKRG